MRKFLTLKNFIVFTLIFILLNLAYLDIDSMTAKSNTNTTSVNVANPLQTSLCANCQTEINQLQTDVNRIMQLNAITITPTLTPTPVVNAATLNSQPTGIPQEYYVPFGSGGGNYSDWTNVPGLQAYVDSNSYGKIKSVVFEVSLHIPTGNEVASVRLVNATDGRVIAGSQIDFKGNTTSELLTSQPLTLDYGQKLYVVQLKTQLNYNAVIDQSRLHISTY